MDGPRKGLGQDISSGWGRTMYGAVPKAHIDESKGFVTEMNGVRRPHLIIYFTLAASQVSPRQRLSDGACRSKPSGCDMIVSVYRPEFHDAPRCPRGAKSRPTCIQKGKQSGVQRRRHACATIRTFDSRR